MRCGPSTGNANGPSVACGSPGRVVTVASTGWQELLSPVSETLQPAAPWFWHCLYNSMFQLDPQPTHATASAVWQHVQLMLKFGTFCTFILYICLILTFLLNKTIGGFIFIKQFKSVIVLKHLFLYFLFYLLALVALAKKSNIINLI